MKKLIILLLIILPAQLLSQNKIEVKMGKFKIDTIDSKYQRLGIFGKDLEPILEQNPLAYHEFKRFKKNQRIMLYGAGLSTIGLASILTAFGTSDQSGGAFGINFPSVDDNKEWMIPFGAISIFTGLVTSISAGVISNVRFRKAVTIYNNTINDFGINYKKETPLIIDLHYRNAGVGITLTF